jgi:valyl-tRNA synthetase
MTRKQRAQHAMIICSKMDLLNEKLSRLEREKILETRADEIFRLEHTIEDVKKQIQHVEQDLKNVELAGTAPENELESHVKKAVSESLKKQTVHFGRVWQCFLL